MSTRDRVFKRGWLVEYNVFDEDNEPWAMEVNITDRVELDRFLAWLPSVKSGNTVAIFDSFVKLWQINLEDEEVDPEELLWAKLVHYGLGEDDEWESIFGFSDVVVYRVPEDYTLEYVQG